MNRAFDKKISVSGLPAIGGYFGAVFLGSRCVFVITARLSIHPGLIFCGECGQLLSWHFDPREERRKERKRRRLEAVEAEEAKLWGDAEQIGGSNAY